MSKKDFIAGYMAAQKSAANPNNILGLTNVHAELAVRAIEIFEDDMELIGYDLSDSYECELGAAEAVSQAADEFDVELSLLQEQEIIDAVVKRLRIDGVIAMRKKARESLPEGEWVYIGSAYDYAKYELIDIPTHGDEWIKLYGDGTTGNVSTAPELGDDGYGWWHIYKIGEQEPIASKEITPCGVGMAREIMRMCDEAHDML